MSDNLHPLAAFFIHHPIWNDELVTAQKSNLNLIRPEAAGAAHYRYGLTKQRVMRIVDFQQNMRSVWVLCRSRMPPALLACMHGTSLAGR
jgi:hypothetical protein